MSVRNRHLIMLVLALSIWMLLANLHVLSVLSPVSDLNTMAEKLSFLPLKTGLVVWMYPGLPKDFRQLELQSGERLLCAYQHVCRSLVGDNEGRFELVNLKSLTQNNTFAHFVENHMFYKVLHATIYPHHVQSIVVCSLLLHSTEDRLKVNNVENLDSLVEACSRYDPTKQDTQPPLAHDFVNDTAFATFSYDSRVKAAIDANSGDEVQSMANIQFLPYITDFVDRDQGLPSLSIENSPLMIANAWYGTRIAFPPKTDHGVSFVSIHMSGNARRIFWNYLNYWKDYTRAVGPVGARDTATLELLKIRKIPSYLSLCFTLMYHMPSSSSSSRESIIVVDVDPELLPQTVVDRAEHMYCNIPDDQRGDSIQRFRWAHNLLLAYSQRAKVVVTSRIHSALPSLAMGIPVIFVDSEVLPGGRRQAGRTEGVADLFHVYRPHVDEWNFDLDNLGINPGVHKVDRYRASFWNHLKRQSSFYVDTAYLYGMVPLRRLGKDVLASNGEPLHQLFHFIFTTDASTLTWRVVRSIEYVFYHHPNARVVIHSNTLPPTGSRLDIFTETGYDLVIESYDFPTLLSQCSSESEKVKKFISKLPLFEKGRHWYSHKSDLLRYMILWKYGGVYLDIDMYVQRPFPGTLTNVLGYQDPFGRSLDGAAMIFEPRHPLLQAALDIVLDEYNEAFIEVSDCIGPTLLNRLHKNAELGQMIRVLDHQAFQPILYNQSKVCFENTKHFAEHVQITDGTYTIQINAMVAAEYNTTRPGSLCDIVLHKYCIFCDEVHTNSSSSAVE